MIPGPNLFSLRAIGCVGQLIFWIALFVTDASAVSAPEWVQPYLTGEAVSWQTREPISALFDFRDARFLSADRVNSTLRGILRANTQEGAQTLGFQVPYNPDLTRVISLKAWVISPKGKVIAVPRQAISDQSASGNLLYWNSNRSFAYSASENAEPGSVLAFEYILESAALFGEYDWAANLAIGIFRAEVSATPAPGCKLLWHLGDTSLPEPAAGPTPGSLQWRIEKVKPLRGARPQGYLPTPVSLAIRCTSAKQTNAASAEDWEELSRQWFPLFEDKAVVTPSIQAAALAETKGKDNRWEKVRALTQLVQKKISYLMVTEDADVFAGMRPHLATEVLARQQGDCKDKVTLLRALLKAIGEKSYPVLVALGHPTAVDPEWPAQRFNHVIVGIPADADVPPWWPAITGTDGNTYVLFDPTARSLPLGCLPTSAQGGEVLLTLPKSGGLVRVTGNFSGLPPIKKNLVVSLQDNGSGKVAEVDEMFGTEGAGLHDQIERDGKEEFTRQLERVLHERTTGARGLKWTENWDPVSAHCTLKLDFEIPDVARRVGKDQLLVTPPFSAGRAALPPWETNHPGVSWLQRIAVDERIEITLPSGVNAPQLPTKLHLENAGAEISLEYNVADNALICVQSYQRPAGLYPKAEYDKLRQIADRAVAARRRPLIFHVPPTTAAAAPATDNNVAAPSAAASRAPQDTVKPL